MKRLCISVAILIALTLTARATIAHAAALSGRVQPTGVAQSDQPLGPVALRAPQYHGVQGQPPPAVETPAPEPPAIPVPGLSSPSCPWHTGQGSPLAAAPVRIRFAPGTISAVRMGRLAPWCSALYVLAASRGQTLEAWVEPAGSGVLLYVWGPNGSELIPGQPPTPSRPLARVAWPLAWLAPRQDQAGRASQDGVSHWTARLPANGDYFIAVNAGDRAADYKLTVAVETMGVRPATRIRFPSGGTSATVSGRLAQGVPGRYVLRALAGQTMEVTPAYPTPGLPYAIWGANGVLLRSFGEPWAPWRGRLPSTQDYYIEVLSPASANPYRLAVTIPPLRSTPMPAPVRIQFRPGATSATVEATLVTGQSVRYVLRALRGQHMTFNIWPTSALTKSVAGPGGSYWDWPFVENHPSLTLPATGDYIITLTAMEPGVETWFTMEVVIPSQ